MSLSGSRSDENGAEWYMSVHQPSLPFPLSVLKCLCVQVRVHKEYADDRGVLEKKNVTAFRRTCSLQK